MLLWFSRFHFWPESRDHRTSGRWAFRIVITSDRVAAARGTEDAGWERTLPQSSRCPRLRRAAGRFQPLLSDAAFVGIAGPGEDASGTLRGLTGTQTLFAARVEVRADVYVLHHPGRQRASKPVFTGSPVVETQPPASAPCMDSKDPAYRKALPLPRCPSVGERTDRFLS